MCEWPTATLPKQKDTGSSTSKSSTCVSGIDTGLPGTHAPDR